MTHSINPAIFQNYIKTTEDVTYLLSLLGTLSTELFKKNRSFEQILEQDVSYQRGLTIKKIAATHGVNLTNASEVVQFVTELTEAINALPVVTVTLAFAPKAALVTVISQWFYITYQKIIILDIKVDRSILAGIIIDANGKHKDYSLRQEVFKPAK